MNAAMAGLLSTAATDLRTVTHGNWRGGRYLPAFKFYTIAIIRHAVARC